MQHYLNLLNFEVYNKKGFYQTGRGLKIEVSNIMKARKAKQNNNKNENNDKNKRIEKPYYFLFNLSNSTIPKILQCFIHFFPSIHDKGAVLNYWFIKRHSSDKQYI